MVDSFIIDMATPVTYTPEDVPVNTEFLHQLLVVLKAATSETTITTLTESPEEVGLEAVARAFTGGMSRVSYIKLADLTGLDTFELRRKYYTIICIGFTATQIGASEFGDYDGVIIYPTAVLGDIVTGVKNVSYCYGALGLKACYTFGKLLSAPNFKNLVYTDSSSNEETIQIKGLAKSWYDAKAIAWAYDNQVGSRLISGFINGKGLSTPYIEQELVIQLQTNSFNIMANSVNYTVEDAKLVEGYNKQIINNFKEAGLLISADYNVSLNPTNTNSFISTLDNLVTPIPIFKIAINVIL